MHSPLATPALLLLAAALTPTIAAQDAAAAAKVDQLVIKTAQAGLAHGVMRHASEEPSELKDGEHYVLTMDEKGGWSCATAQGKVAFVSVVARPALLMETFADQVDQVRGMAKAGAAMGAATSPMKPKDMAAMMDAIFDFPSQLDTVSIVIERDQKGGYDAQAELVPLAQGALARTVASLKPSGRGAPELAGEAAMSFAVDVDPACFKDMSGFIDKFIMGMIPKEERESSVKLMDQTVAAMDGTWAFTMRGGQMRMLFGCADVQKMQQLFLSDDWTKFQRATFAGMPDAELKVTREKLGDLDVMKMDGDLGQDGNPVFPDGKFSGYSCIAGGMMVSVVNAGKDAFQDMVTRATTGKLKRAPLADGALLTIRVSLGDLIAMAPNAPPVDAGEFPSLIDIRVGKKDKATLKIGVRVEM